MGYVDKLIALDFKIAGVITWYDEEGRVFNFPLEIPFPKQ
tara:strand:- start:695 stop:814 length:120 start_codon:yes stop_codon:yes gene_type:complete